MSGDDLMKQAAKCIDSRFFSFFNDYEGAYENYMRAASYYKVDKQWDKALQACILAKDIAIYSLKNINDELRAYNECIKLFPKAGTSKEIGSMVKKAQEIYIFNNNLTQAAKLLMEWSKHLEECNEKLEAIDNYKKASNYFLIENQSSSALQCNIRIATLLAMNDKFIDACILFEKNGDMCVDNKLYKTKAREHYLNAFLCKIASIKNDNIMENIYSLEEMIGKFLETDTFFNKSREYDICESLLNVMEENNEQKLDEIIQSLEKYKMLDDLRTRVMICIKDNFTSVL